MIEAVIKEFGGVFSTSRSRPSRNERKKGIPVGVIRKINTVGVKPRFPAQRTRIGVNLEWRKEDRRQRAIGDQRSRL
jgi:hypothetical protein